MKKKYKKTKLNIKRISILLVILILLISLGVIILNLPKKERIEKMNLTFKDRVADLKNYKYEDYLTVGWLQVQGTNIDYPILNHDAANIDPTSTNYGWRSPYYVTGENREVLLGHNIINVSSTPSRDMNILNNFEGLMAFTYEDFAENNLYISYTKDDEIEIYKIYAIGFYDYYSDNAESFSETKEIKEYIKEVRKNSIYDYDVDVNETDQLLTIKTCTRYFGLFDKQQLYVDARKVRENEEILKYKVEKNDNYNTLSEGAANEKG